jgi:hypothetical protein
MGYLWIYLVGDMSIYLIYKIARRDLVYWLPITSTIGAYSVSTLIRIGVKLMADFTGKSLRRG